MHTRSAFMLASLALALLPRAGRAIDRDSIAGAIDGFISVEAGRVEEGLYKNFNFGGPIERQWLSATKLNLGFDKTISGHLRVGAAVEGKMWLNASPGEYQVSPKQYNMPTTFFDFYLDNAQIIFSTSSQRRFALETGLGYFPYKYNPDSRNLGEYLLRSGTYPAFLLSEFDYPKIRLAGLRLDGRLGDVFPTGLLVTSEVAMQPFYDISLSWLVGANVKRIVDIGAGVSLRRLIPADTRLTTAHDAQTTHFTSADSSDTSYYTLSGVNVMARAAFDPKRIFRRGESSGFFNEEDAKLYAEVALLGAKSYPSNEYNPYGYDVLNQKIPVMAGFNIPSHPLISNGTLALVEALALYPGFFRDKLGIPAHPVVAYAVFPVLGLGTWALQRFLNIDAAFDLCAFEIQYFGCPYPNSFYQVAAYHLALPSDLRKTITDSKTYSVLDNWKWSLYLKKDITDRLSLTAQAARDHVRLPVKWSEDVDREELMSLPAHWYWMIKVMVAM